MGRKPEKIKIRCEEDTQVEWQEFAAGYRDYEAALRDMLRVYRELPGQFRRRG